ncbi:MAG: Hpt protein [Ignavibacteria bacterium]|nr:Hpt protein [Ignavibacteria bacterium]
MKIPDDPVIRELLPEFIDTWINDIETQFHKLMTEKNSEDMYRLAHTIKGSCFQFGIDEIAQIGIELMGYMKESNWDKAVGMDEILLTEFKKVKNLIESGAPI